MPHNPTDEVVVRLPAGEWNELIVQVQRSISWTQAILNKIVIQAQQQEPTNAQPQPPPPNGGSVAQLGREGRRPRSTVFDGGSNSAA